MQDRYTLHDESTYQNHFHIDGLVKASNKHKTRSEMSAFPPLEGDELMINTQNNRQFTRYVIVAKTVMKIHIFSHSTVLLVGIHKNFL